MKYEKGDFVSKPVTGICKIEDILYLTPGDEKNKKLYYVMKPVEDEKEKNIYSSFEFKTEIVSDKRRSMEFDQENSRDSDSMDK